MFSDLEPLTVKVEKSVVTFNAKAINKLTETRQEPTTIIQAINDNCSAEEIVAPDGDHYLEVTLEGLDSNSIFLSQDKSKRISWSSRASTIRLENMEIHRSR